MFRGPFPVFAGSSLALLLALCAHKAEMDARTESGEWAHSESALNTRASMASPGLS